MKRRVDEVMRWYVGVHQGLDEDVRRACLLLLRPKEMRQLDSFVFEKDRHEYLFTRALERGTLAHALQMRPNAVAFRRTDLGRPELVPASDFTFNLTNTSQLVACAVAHKRAVGVDAEPLDRAEQIMRVAPTVFTPRERSELDAMTPAARARAAVELWTLKEAYIKARGLGMTLPVDHIEVRRSSHERFLRFLTNVDDQPARWRFTTFEIEGHLVSACVEKRRDEAVTVTARRADLRQLLVPYPTDQRCVTSRTVAGDPSPGGPSSVRVTAKTQVMSSSASPELSTTVVSAYAPPETR